jgi:hypothetical protein
MPNRWKHFLGQWIIFPFRMKAGKGEVNHGCGRRLVVSSGGPAKPGFPQGPNSPLYWAARSRGTGIGASVARHQAEAHRAQAG